MTGANIIWLLSVWGCAVMFTGIGIYAGKRKLPMWFWAGSTVPPESIRDIPAYNRENRRMWCLFSIPFWITGISYYWFPTVSVNVMTAATILGIPWLIWSYLRIERRYKI